ncbi:hypothetical protein N3K66_008809 [Trichothecium roseum]|uniref:Uncharacterized protein n=1 Tax=Trichothecium roseum TaxID=47278 RepID=A0ACC0USZ7_9HYPO|nr:hypothetical protein N3K66_008809 [Trichothecium roseum]
MNTLVHATACFDGGIGLARSPKMYLARYGKDHFEKPAKGGGQVKQPFDTVFGAVQFVLAEAVAPMNPSASKSNFQVRRSAGRCCEELRRADEGFQFSNPANSTHKKTHILTRAY